MTENKTQNPEEPQPKYRRYWPWVAIVVVILFAAAIRVRLLEVPLERDEGHYAYAGQLMLQGVAPYTEVYTYFLPGMYAIYALIMSVFGQTHVGIHLGLLIINAVTILLIFLLAKELFDPLVGVVTAAAFALLSLGQYVEGFFANSEHFVIFFALSGILLLVRAVKYQKWSPLLAASLLLGLAFIIKQHSAAFIIFAGLYLFLSELRRRPFFWKPFAAKCILFAVGVLLPFIITCLILWWCGVFEKFLFWTFEYARHYTSAIPLSVGLGYGLKVRIIPIVGSAILLWILAGIGLTGLFWDKKAHRHSLFVLGFLVLSFLAVCPGLYFRPHYFILLLPAVALLAGIGAGCIRDILARGQTASGAWARLILLALIVVLHTVYNQRNFLFVLSPTMVSRITYGVNPFPESLEIARFISENSSKDDRIAIMGSEAQIFFYANRCSATGHIFTYQLMEPHPYALQMQQEMIREIESASPKFLIFVNIPGSWMVRPKSERLIFEWFEEYRKKYYRQVGVIDIISMQQAVYRWGRESLEYSPQSKYWICVFRRKS